MLIVNKNIYHYNGKDEREDRGEGTSDSWLLRESKILEGKLIYYVEFKDQLGARRIFENVNDITLNAIRNGTITLVVCNAHEAFHKVVPSLYQTIIQCNINPSKVYFLTGSLSMEKVSAQTAQSLNCEKLNLIWSGIFEHSVQSWFHEQISNGKLFNTLEKKDYFKSYINFNRRWRTHRPVIVALLHCKNLIKKGFVSLAPSDDQRNFLSLWWYLLSIHNEERSPQVFKILNENEMMIKSLPPMYLDTLELHINQAELKRETDIYYHNTYFSLVSETNFYQSVESEESGIFFSEKTFKPIAEMHPFILINAPGSLRELKKLGYKTFHPFINEEYDNEVDDDKRMIMIVNEVERLSNFSKEEIFQFIDNVKPICEFNWNLLKNKKYPDFLKVITYDQI